jgi:hypothetical protein
MQTATLHPILVPDGDESGGTSLSFSSRRSNMEDDARETQQFGSGVLTSETAAFLQSIASNKYIE